MIKEAYVSFETAKLLKAKGFDVRCHSHYWAQDKENPRYSDFEQNWNCASEDWYSRPTHQMACVWLREKHNIFIRIGYNRYYKVYKYDVFSMDIDIENEHSVFSFKSYEESVENALKYTLENLI